MERERQGRYLSRLALRKEDFRSSMKSGFINILDYDNLSFTKAQFESTLDRVVENTLLFCVTDMLKAPGPNKPNSQLLVTGSINVCHGKDVLGTELPDGTVERRAYAMVLLTSPSAMTRKGHTYFPSQMTLISFVLGEQN